MAARQIMFPPSMWWSSAAAFALMALALLLPLAWLWPAEQIRRSRRAVILAASIFWPAFAVLMLQSMWDGYYGFFFPTWMKWALPFGAAAIYSVLAFGCHWLASRLPGHPLLWFGLFVGLLGDAEHLAAWYSWQLPNRVPYLADAPLIPVLGFAFFEYQVYWAIALWLAWALSKLAEVRSHGAGSNRRRPSTFVWRLLKLPRVWYALGLGPVAGQVILLLTTTGRKTGRPRVTPLQYEEHNGVIYVASARGQQADWYRNLLAHPRVEVRVRARRFNGQAEPITDPARVADFLQLRLQRHPRMMGAMLRGEGLPARPTREQLEQFAQKIAVVAIRPCVDEPLSSEARP